MTIAEPSVRRSLSALSATVEVRTSVFIDALAAIGALEGFTSDRLSQHQDEPSGLQDWAGELCQALETEVFGRSPSGDDEWARDPVIVAMWAREAELEAELLDRLAACKAEMFEYDRRRELRARAERTREQGTVA